ncbi:proline dehydrogenase family protein [Motilibacter aurantiacus]|uniref:proline dehydrogenase family protein n=1 Tax=Motilibacter aurantiacus TaxID=2714955 RepID=UPI0014089D9B|nr:proline dehydrogenase family protein [Motilibacter aurantiacus]NHC45552.1 proline dehydrogenase [Motilibacter aurantiacus]
MDHLPLVPPAALERAADALRAWALDEGLKARVMAHPELSPLAARVARRYVAGDSIEEALAAARSAVQRGHAASIEYTGESVRDAELARREADVFVELATAIRAAGLPSTVSFDLSHVGAVVDEGLTLDNVRRMATAADAAGATLMVSAEGSGRTDLVLGLYERLCAEQLDVGITLQARLHRTPRDLDRVLRHPGPVRLVKGAFREPESLAYPRGSAELTAAYLDLAGRLLAEGHRVSLATHDPELVSALVAEHGDRLREEDVEFEMLRGLGTALLDGLRAEGYPTREYVVFGGEWWLYVLNRIAEHPERALLALADLAPGLEGT